jgi:hypothetical protein
MNVCVYGAILQSCRFPESSGALPPSRNTTDSFNEITGLRSFFDRMRRGIPVAYRPTVVDPAAH